MQLHGVSLLLIGAYFLKIPKMINIEATNDKIQDQIGIDVNKVSSFRRFAPQVIVTIIKNLFAFIKTLVESSSSIIIPALLGISITLNPNETIKITSSEASWLSSLTFIGHPFGSVLSGFVSDAIGRRRGMLLCTLPALIGFILLSFAESFTVVCLALVLLSFVLGLKDAPSTIYVSEISEPSIRGAMLTFAVVAGALGRFTVHLLGSFLSWRQVSLACATLPIVIASLIYFIPESPNWLLLKDRPKEAQKSLQWLRGWVSPEAVRDEFSNLKKHSIFSNACVSCMKQSIECHHPRATFCDKIKELKRKRTLKPLILVLSLDIFMEFSLIVVWRPYIIQIIKAFGIPINANLTTTILSSISIAATCVVFLSVHSIGKRRLYLISSTMVVFCCLGLCTYGFIFFPSNWTSFKDRLNPSIPNFDHIRDIVGDYGYLALALLCLMQFCAGLGQYVVPFLIQSEVFSLKLRSFLLGTTVALRNVISSIAAKTYYNIETWLTPAGAALFYGIISFIGLVTMYFILPETENRSLEDIELHYADNSKGMTDIEIARKTKQIS